MSSHSFRYILSTHTHWWGLTNAAPYISKCLDILLIPATSHILLVDQPIFGYSRSRGCRALGELWTAPLSDAQGARLPFLAKHGEFPGENTGGFHRENGGFDRFSPANIGDLWSFVELNHHMAWRYQRYDRSGRYGIPELKRRYHYNISRHGERHHMPGKFGNPNH